MNGWLVANLAGTALMVGFIWTIQLLTYPMMKAVPADGFVAYELMHRNRVTALLAVLAPIEIVAAAGVVVFVDDVPAWLSVGAGVLLFAIWLSTLLFYAPLHMRLSTDSTRSSIADSSAPTGSAPWRGPPAAPQRSP